MKTQIKPDEVVNITYDDFLEVLKTEFGEFIKYAENARWTNKNHLPLKTRKKSLLLRDLLKQFRTFSIFNEKEIKRKK